MKHLVTKLFFIAILVLGISSFVLLKTDKKVKKDEVENIRFNAEMDNGFSDREKLF